MKTTTPNLRRDGLRVAFTSDLTGARRASARAATCGLSLPERPHDFRPGRFGKPEAEQADADVNPQLGSIGR